MKRIVLTILTIITLTILVLLGEIHGFRRGYEQGRKTTNTWWIDQKSRLYDTSKMLKNDTVNGYNQI